MTIDLNTSWREDLSYALEKNGETFDNIESSTLTEEQLDRRFDSGYGGIEGDPFTIWTSHYVYFPICYDGSEWVGFVARNPNGIATQHQGGG